MKAYLFQGADSRSCNAVFSSLENAAAWIRKHSLTGIVLAYWIDDPGFERRRRDGKLPTYFRDRDDPCPRELFVDNSEHYHFYLGLGEDDEGFGDACDKWHAQRDE